MEQLVKAVSRRVEFSIVVAVAFGYLIFGSVFSIFAPGSSAPISEAGLKFLLTYELVIILTLGRFLSMRGWNLQQLGFAPTIRDTGIGVGLALFAYFAYVAI